MKYAGDGKKGILFAVSLAACSQGSSSEMTGTALWMESVLDLVPWVRGRLPSERVRNLVIGCSDSRQFKKKVRSFFPDAQMDGLWNWRF